MLPNSQPESAGLQPQQRFKYLVCRHGRNITIKRSDRNHDFGTVLCERDTYAKAKRFALYFRIVREYRPNAAGEPPARKGNHERRH